MAANEPPKILYKYRPCDKYNEDIILGNELYLPRPSTFNDPFDCRGRIVLDGTDEELRGFLRDHVMTTMKIAPENVESILDRLFSDDRAQMYRSEQFSRQVSEHLRNGMEVLCMSEVRDNIVMWSHYADHHKGLCLGFSTENSGLLRAAEKVEYKSTLPVLNVLRASREDVNGGLVGTKFSAWDYEREWRVVRAATAHQRYPLPRGTLVEVVFGWRIPAHDRRQIVRMVHYSRTQVKYFQAREDERAYALQIVPVPLSDERIREALEG